MSDADRLDKVLDEMDIPESGTQEWENMIDDMRKYDTIVLKFEEQYSGVINAARKSIESRGLNFDEEFAKWQADKGV
jgi:hypothetical protein